MRKLAVICIVLSVTVAGLWSLDLSWGIKYGLGSSNLNGEDRTYELGYDIQNVGVVNAPLGYLTLNSLRSESGTAQSLGLYGSVHLVKETDSVRLQTELLWERFRYEYLFEGSALSTNSLLLATQFADTLQGSIRKTVDYLSLPLLIRLQQELTEEQQGGEYQGAYIYLGPSIGILVSNSSGSRGGIKALESNIDSFVLASQTDADAGQSYVSERRESGSDQLLSYKTDLVMGLGFGLKDIFQLGLGKDSFVFDLRYTAGLHDLGKAPIRKAFRMRSIVVSIGVML
jgi:hypothetical protein